VIAKVTGWEFVALYDFVLTSILLVISVVLSENAARSQEILAA
jgi:hypothetical protein